MKKSKIAFIILLVMALVFFVLVGGIGYIMYKETQKTPDEIIEIEKLKTKRAYEANLEKALSERTNYDFVVVLDPAHGGLDAGYENVFGTENDITLAICNKVLEGNTDLTMGIFLTRTDDVGMDNALRLSFVECVQPDLFIEMHLNKSTSVLEYGTAVSYDTTYFNRKLTNVEFADIMEKSVVSAIEGYARGISDVTDMEESSLLKGLTIPAVSISCGYLSNEKEGELLTRELYQENLANGILAGIREAKERLEK